MKKIGLTVMLFMIVFLMSSCVSMGPKYGVLKPTFPEMKAETGRVFFYRPVGFGGGVQPVIMLNGKEIGKTMPMAFFFLDLPPDNYTAEVTTEVTRKVSFALDRGEVRYIRFHVTMGFFVGHVNGELVSEKLAFEELENCSYSTGTPCQWDEVSKPVEVLEKCKYSPEPKSIEKKEESVL